MAEQNLKIVFAGGGTGGSVTPLLAVYQYLLQEQKIQVQDCLWLGTRSGLEKNLVTKAGLQFYGLASGKLRRYFSPYNFIDPIFIIFGFFQSLFILARQRPAMILTAGSFVAVPVAWAGWLLRIPICVHQMDVEPGLANKLMAPFAKIITVTFAKSLADYPTKARVIGNSVRPEIFTANLLDPLVIRQEMSFVPSLPIVLIVGGGTGARALNRLMLEARPKLEEFCQLVHQTGGKVDTVTTSSHYRQLDFIDVADLARFYRVADLVVSRAGMGFITELSYLHKPSIIIPMPSSHQEANAQVLADAEAAVVLSESDLDADFLVDVIKKLLADNNARQELAVNIGQIIGQEANQKMLTIVEELAK